MSQRSMPGELELYARAWAQSGSQLKGSWLKRNVQWAAFAQEGLKKASASSGLCVRVINRSSQFISLVALALLRGSIFLALLGLHQLAGRGQPVPEVGALRNETCVWGEGLVSPNLVTIHSCQLYPAGVSSFYSQQQLLLSSPSPSVGAPAQDKS